MFTGSAAYGTHRVGLTNHYHLVYLYLSVLICFERVSLEGGT